MTAQLIGIDWGTSSFRAWLMDAAGAVIDSLAAPCGILSVEGGDFEGAFARLVGHWPAVPVIASGMIASRNGWVEAPYLPLPLDAAALAAGLVAHRAGGRVIHFVPGALGESGGLPDVMRGEETEIAGHLAAGGADGLFVLPGTHSKWAQVESARLTAFRTAMTGEVHALLMAHSILGRLATARIPAEPDEGTAGRAPAFARGLAIGRSGGALLARAFSARTLALTGQLAADEIGDYLSGLLIGDEVAAMLAGMPAPAAPVTVTVTVIGRGDLAARYAAALEECGVSPRIAPPGMAREGLRAIGKQAGLIR